MSRMVRQASVLAIGCFTLSIGVSFAQDAAPTPSDPVKIERCSVPHGGWLFKGGRAMPIAISFRNSTNSNITSIRIDVQEAGVPKGGTTFSGTFAPHILIEKNFLDFEAANIDVNAITCSVSRVRFADGTLWRGNNANSVIVRQPDAPIEIRDCGAVSIGSGAPTYNEALTLSFTNVAQKPLTAVKFGFDLYDSFDTKLTSIAGTVHGEFSPGALIEPRTSGSQYIYSPSSPAWRYYFGPGSADNIFRGFAPNDIATAKCYIVEARFADGEIWRASHQDTAPVSGVRNPR